MAQMKGQTTEWRGLWDQGVASLQTLPVAKRKHKWSIRFTMAQTEDLMLRKNRAVDLSLARSLPVKL